MACEEAMLLTTRKGATGGNEAPLFVPVQYKQRREWQNILPSVMSPLPSSPPAVCAVSSSCAISHLPDLVDKETLYRLEEAFVRRYPFVPYPFIRTPEVLSYSRVPLSVQAHLIYEKRGIELRRYFCLAPNPSASRAMTMTQTLKAYESAGSIFAEPLCQRLQFLGFVCVGEWINDERCLGLDEAKSKLPPSPSSPSPIPFDVGNLVRMEMTGAEMRPRGANKGSSSGGDSFSGDGALVVYLRVKRGAGAYTAGEAIQSVNSLEIWALRNPWADMSTLEWQKIE